MPAPIPPPRTKKNAKLASASHETNTNSVKNIDDKPVDEPLIQLDSMDEISLFDPLKDSSALDENFLSFLAPKAVSDSRVAELKNTIQNLTSTSSNPMTSTFYQTSTYFPPRVAQPGIMIPRYPVAATQPSIVSSSIFTSTPQSNGISPLVNSQPEEKPALPPKTRPSSSRFFVASSEISDVDKELLSDYGLSNSPIFQNTFTEKSKFDENDDWLSSSTEEKMLNTLDPFSSISVKKDKSPKSPRKQTQAHPTWQKFT